MLIYASCDNIVFSKSRKEINRMKLTWLGVQSFTIGVYVKHADEIRDTEMEMSSIWRNFHYWLHRMLSKWQLPMQPVTILSKMTFPFQWTTVSDTFIMANKPKVISGDDRLSLSFLVCQYSDTNVMVQDIPKIMHAIR